ncbi:MAG TPA: GNAT family N-acetyltransferase [Xanthomonadales bacterium]|nr:GNAT family N-acetyltransferase [Xanthomonadales bacterium]
MTRTTVAESERLRLRLLDVDDAAFMLALVNDPSWLRNIGDRGVRSLDDARAYLRKGPIDMYARHGFGLYAIELKSGEGPLGICGLIQRDSLPDVDIGYALLPQYVGQGYALEAAQASVTLARERFGLQRLIAITAPDNAASARLLVRIGMHFERHFSVAPDSEVLCLYAMAL